MIKLDNIERDIELEHIEAQIELAILEYENYKWLHEADDNYDH